MRPADTDRRERSMGGNDERILFIAMESKIFHYSSFLSRYCIKGEPQKVWREALQTFMENSINTAALVKTLTENIHLKLLKVKRVKTKDINNTPLLENRSQDTASTRKIMQQTVNLRGPWNQNDQVCDVAENGNWQIQRGWKVQRLNPSCNFLNHYEQGKTTLVYTRQGIIRHRMMKIRREKRYSGNSCMGTDGECHT